ARVGREALVGGDPKVNADLARRVLAGEAGPHRDIVCLNAAAGLVAAGVVDELADGLERAQQAIDDGWAAQALDALVTVSQREAATACPSPPAPPGRDAGHAR